MSPTCIGLRNVAEEKDARIAVVGVVFDVIFLLPCRLANMYADISISFKIVPPWTLPAGLASSGSINRVNVVW